MKKIACVIPARLHASRFPKKLLRLLNGKSILQWSWEAALKIPFFDTVSIAVDAEETAKVVDSFGGKFYFTSPSCISGTERVAELQKEGIVSADIFVNWQADEPFMTPSMIQKLLQNCAHSSADVWTLKKKIHIKEEITSPHIVKVVTDEKECALYFSRSPIPFQRESTHIGAYYKHIGLYAYTARALERISNFTPSELEKTEHLEQLTFLYHGLKIEVHETNEETLGIDTPEQLKQAEKFLL